MVFSNHAKTVSENEVGMYLKKAIEDYTNLTIKTENDLKIVMDSIDDFSIDITTEGEVTNFTLHMMASTDIICAIKKVAQVNLANCFDNGKSFSFFQESIDGVGVGLIVSLRFYN